MKIPAFFHPRNLNSSSDDDKKKSPKAVSLGASVPYWAVDLAIFGDRGGQNREKNELFREKIQKKIAKNY